MSDVMRRPYAERLQEIQPFKVMKLLARANQLQAEGHQVVHMEVGEPDFPTPQPIVEAGIAALQGGKTKYTPAQGTPALREAISRHYEIEYGVQVDPGRIFITAGGSGALLLASALLLNPGEGLLMSDPGYPCNRHFLKAFCGEGQLVPVTAADDYQLTAQLVSDHWLPSSRGVLLASPANPTGAIIDPLALAAIAKLVQQRRGHLLVDEIYHGLTYDDSRPSTVLATDPEAFVLNSFSKYFGMTGWRLGWLIVPDSAVNDIEKLAQNLFICPSSIAQEAALAAFSAPAREIMEQQREAFLARRNFLVPALRELGFGVPVMPQGAFYVYATLPPGFTDSESFCDTLLERYHLAVTPGTDFGFHLANQHVRFSYAQRLDVLAEGVDRLRRALPELARQ
jgi:aspartate/methionine/tyrosine aminotransferase